MSAHPAWFVRLKEAVANAECIERGRVMVETADLKQAVGACDDGPAGTAMVGATDDGMVAIEYQALLKAVYLTPDEADSLADTLKRKAGLVRYQSTASDPGANHKCEQYREGASV